MHADVDGTAQLGDAPACALASVPQVSPRSGTGEASRRDCGHGRSERLLENGFDTIPELEAIQVDEEHIAPFSLPQEALSFQPDVNTLIAHFKNGDRERMIHCNVPLEKEEQKSLDLLRKEVRLRGKAFFPSIVVAAVRFLSDARGDHYRAIEKMEAAQEWRTGFFKHGPLTSASVADDLKYGVMYFSGRDHALRPLLVVRPARAPADLISQQGVEKFTRVVTFCMEYFLRFMAVPGKVENLNVLVDLKDLALSQIPLSALLEIRSVLSRQYTGRVFRFYICNMPWTLRAISGMVQAAMTDRQREKIVFVQQATDLQREFALHHLEEDLGGTRPIFREFFPFPLQAGPFMGGWHQGPCPDAVPKVHEAMSANAARGRLWDLAKSREENCRLEYEPCAEHFFRNCGMTATGVVALPGAPTTFQTQASLDNVWRTPTACSQLAHDSKARTVFDLRGKKDESGAMLDKLRDDQTGKTPVLEDVVIRPVCSFSCTAVRLELACWLVGKPNL